MLIKCPECDLQVSDRAQMCPHCGYPIESISGPPPNIKPRRSKKRMRLPNGFGQISELKGRNLRKPFRVMVTVGKGENGKPICKLLKPEAYFETYNDAYAALVAYNQNPYELSENITVKELYERWSPKYYEDVSHSTKNKCERAWRYCEPLYDMNVKDIRIRHIKGCMEEHEIEIRGKITKANADTQNIIKKVFSKMLDYAIEYDIVDKNVARSFSLSKETVKEMYTVKKGHHAFSDEEINTLWNNLDTAYVDMILCQCYSGWRPGELCELKVKNVDIVNGFIVGGIKTDAGINRIVPIHSKIFAIIQARYEIATHNRNEYLFGYDSSHITYDTYHSNFRTVMKKLQLDTTHTPHDCRKHFITQAKKYKLDEYAIKHIVGHAIRDITEKTYTERDPQWLKSEIEKIK